MSHLDAIEIPDKTYFKIGEVAKLLDLEPYVLRYWESEFEVLDPDKTDSGQRIYQRADIELIFQIRDLLYNEMFTIAGARRQLELEREGKLCYFNVEAAASDDSEQLAALEADKAELEANNAELEASNAELREQLEALDARLQQTQAAQDALPDDWEAQLAARDEQVEALDRQLAKARETIARLEAEQKAAKGLTQVDQSLLHGLRDQIEGLARLGQRPV